MKNIIPTLAVATLLATSCEKAFIPEGADAPPQIVVEGYIEGGERPAPPFVILTRNVPFFSEFGPEDLENTFVHDAIVKVSDGEKTAELSELCLDELSEEEKRLASALFGFNPDSLGFNFCVYIDLSFSMRGEEGKSYTLEVEAEGQRLQSVTSIPRHAALDSLQFRNPPGEANDTLAQLLCFLADPAGEANFYRYQVAINDSGFISPFASVFDDRLTNGQYVEFPLFKPEPRGTQDFDLETLGLYRVGDTVTVKWITLDKEHYNFWNTLEFNAANQGPFSSYTLIDSNIEGGLGIWGGLSASYYELKVLVD
ncbi:MAG: DUF4249 domain-containing protein [Phaeodactylibacter sp.]|nr:DUF4249 domain-containing protein [Phaeodactylibacter sp.]